MAVFDEHHWQQLDCMTVADLDCCVNKMELQGWQKLVLSDMDLFDVHSSAVAQLAWNILDLDLLLQIEKIVCKGFVLRFGTDQSTLKLVNLIATFPAPYTSRYSPEWFDVWIVFVSLKQYIRHHANTTSTRHRTTVNPTKVKTTLANGNSDSIFIDSTTLTTHLKWHKCTET